MCVSGDGEGDGRPVCNQSYLSSDCLDIGSPARERRTSFAFFFLPGGVTRTLIDRRVKERE